MFIYVQHAFVTAPNSKSQMKGFGQTKEANLIDERVEFKLKYKQKLADKCTYVIDLANNKCVRNSFRHDPDNPVTDQKAITYIVKEYEKEILEYLRSLKGV